MLNKNNQIVIMEVENKAGVLNKVTSLCRRRRYNIKSLTVGETEKKGISHLTLVFEKEEQRINQIVNQIDKLIEVLKIEVVESSDVIDKEMVLLIVKSQKTATKLLKKSMHDVEVKVINNLGDNPVMQIVGESGEIEHILGELDFKKDVIKIIRSGVIALKI